MDGNWYVLKWNALLDVVQNKLVELGEAGFRVTVGVIRKMLLFDPEKRLTVRQVVKSLYEATGE